MSAGSEGEHGGTRRDFLYVATGAAGAVAVAGVAIPLVGQMGPNARELAAGAPVDLDISAIEPGQVVTIVWRGAPYFVRRLTEAEVAAAKDNPVTSYVDYVPADQRIASPEAGTSEWAIMAANCTHLGCVPTRVDATGVDGWVCACHGSKFDVTGRVTKGPAPVNLPMPPFVFASDTRLVIGTDKAGA